MNRKWGEKVFAHLRLMLCMLLVAGLLHADEVDSFVRTRMAEQKLPGAAFAVMRHGRLVRT